MKRRRFDTGGSRASFWFTVGVMVLFLAIVAPWRRLPALWGRAAAHGEVIPPRPASMVFVNDFAGVIDAGTRSRISAMLEAHERATSNEVVVVTVPSLRGLARQEFANRLFNAWGLGKKGKDNGVLLLVAPTEREAQFEVGYGLEPVLTDGTCGEITRQEMIPHFKRGDYPGGILAGMTRVVSILSGAREHPREPESGSENVRDTAGILTGEARTNVLHYIALLRERAHVEFGVVTQPSLLGVPVGETATHWVSALGLEKRGGDRWVFLLVVRNPAGASLIPGPGVIGRMSAESASRIARTEFDPAFRSGNAGGAFWSTSAAVWRVLGETPGRTGPATLGGLAAMTAFLAVFIGIGAFMCGAGFATLRVFPVLFGMLFGGVPLFSFSVPYLFGVSSGFWFFACHVVLAVVLFVVGWRVGKRNPSMFGTKKRGGDSGWSWGGGGGSGGGFGGGGGGGGFGGGSSGGGGGGGSW